jgi:hypothetical protein
MKSSVMFALLASAFCFTFVPVLAQVDMTTLTARAGIIRTQWPDNSQYDDHLWAFYPELEVGGSFIAPYLTWGASWGYWSDGIAHALPVADMITYSQSGHIVAVRFGFRPQILDNRWPLPVTVLAGAAEHFSKNTYVGGRDFTGNRGQNSTDESTTAFVGLGISYPLLTHLNLEGEVLQFIPFGDRAIDTAQKNRRSLKFGAAVSF